MSGNGNPAWTKGGPSPNPGGRARPERQAARSLAMACREAASDEEIAEWLLTIASGRWPDIRPLKADAAKPLSIAMDSGPPDGTHRMGALKMFLERRDGQPMQAVVLKAELEMRSRQLANATDAIVLDDIDPMVAGVVEAALTKSLGLLGDGNEQPIIDVVSTED